MRINKVILVVNFVFIVALFLLLALISNVGSLIIVPILYTVLIIFQLITATLLESPMLAFINTLALTFGMNILKRYVLLIAFLMRNALLYYLVFSIDSFIRNPITYLTIFATYITLYYSWTFIVKKGDSLIESIKRRSFNIEIKPKNVLIIMLLSLLLIILRPLTLLDEIIYLTGVLISSLFIRELSQIAILSPLLSWILIPYTIHIPPREVSRGKKLEIVREGIVLGKLIASLTYGKPVNEWLKDRVSATKSPSWYWRIEDEKYVFNPYVQVNYHVLIAGTSGTGKSSLAKKLVKELYLTWGIPSLILDPHNEYVNLIKQLNGVIVDASKISINPLELDGASPRERTVQVADTLQRVFKLGNLQRTVLEDLIEEAYAEKGILIDDEESWNNTPPTFQTLLRVVEKRIEYARTSAERARYESLKPYLRTLSITIFRNTTIEFQKLLEKPSVIAMANLPGEYVKSILAETVLRKIAHKMYAAGEKQRLLNYIVIDEAHRLCRRGVEPSLVAKLMMESRKYGIGFIIITQQPLDIDESIVANAATKISFKLAEPENLDYIAKTFAGFVTDNRYDMVRKALYYLPMFHAIIKDSVVNDPIIVRIDISS